MRMVAEAGRPLRDPTETVLWLDELPQARLIFLVLLFTLCSDVVSLLDNVSAELEREGFSYNQEL